MTASVAPQPTRSLAENQRLRIAARLGRLWRGTYLSVFPDEELIVAGILTFDPFQARTLPVFESIYRYGRGMIS